ncbi:MAG: hypothetical protein COB26_06125 [Piscirickettsiaceae bacterium]|nr:MAG: hypothetical protein COB89_04000 [Piscirickettsiaceae bacterium]PCI69524.1 MAG: hypothetical protein COB26_06125 [Piscirickettsiaceae bacterium]
MRQVFLLLIFANTLLYFWANMVRTGGEESAFYAPLYEPVSIEILHIVSDDTPPFVTTKNKATVLANKNEQKLCLEIGSFEREKAISVSQWLSGLSQHLLIVSNDQLLVKNYWVISPAAKTWQKSIANADYIKSKGISDMWLVPNGSDRGTVSLGLFVDKDKAAQRMEEMLSETVNAEIIEIIKERKSIRLENILNPSDIFKQLNKIFIDEEINIQKINC